MSTIADFVEPYAGRRAEIAAADFNNARASWREFVPDEVVQVWGLLPFEAQLAVFLTAMDAFFAAS